MAQVVNVSPVQIEDDGSSARFLSVINSQIESRRKQEEAMRQAAIKQREDNMRLFGDGVENLQKYSEIDFLAPVVSNRIIQEETRRLAEAIKNGNAQVDVPLLMLNTSQRISSLKNYKTNVEEAKTRIKELYPSVSDQNIISLANKYFYKQTKNPDGTVTEDVNWDNLPKIQDLILGEFKSNPSRYADLPALSNSMSRVIGGVKTELFEDKRRMDPTGTKLTSIGVKVNMMPFEELIEITDQETGLKVKVPGIKVVPFAEFKRPDGTPYNVVSDNTFNGLKANADKSLTNMFNVQADAMVVDHNTQVIYNSLVSANPKMDKEVALELAREKAVGANAQGSVELEKSFPGFVNKYIPSNMDAFVRIAATKALSDMGRYNPDGTVNNVQYDRGIVRDNPSSPRIIINNAPGTTPPPIQGWANVVRGLGGGEKPLGQVVGAIEAEPFVRFANDNAKMPSMLGMNYSPDAIRLRFNNDNTVTVIAGTQEIPTKISQRDYEIMLNERFSKKDETNAATYNYNNQGGPMPTVVPRTPTLRPGNPR